MKRLLFGLALLTGCSSGNVGLNLKIASSSTQSQALQSAETATGTSVLPSGVAVDRARLLLNEVEMHQGDHQVAGRATRGPYILTLTGADLVSAQTVSVADVTVPAATYTDLELELEPYDTSESPVATGSSATAAELADFTAAGASAIVEGTYNGTAFTIVSKLEADRVTQGSFVVADGTPIDVAITIDPSTWFVDDAGVVLDPTVAANNDAIAMKLCLSLDPGDSTRKSSCYGETTRPGGPGGGRGGPGAPPPAH